MNLEKVLEFCLEFESFKVSNVRIKILLLKLSKEQKELVYLHV
jgi:hypothetical protein